MLSWLLLRVALFLVPVGAFGQSFEVGPAGFRVYDGRPRVYDDRPRGGGVCGELRAACENKDRLGERGEGNCR